MSTTTPSRGSHFSDGVRTGAIFGSQFTAGANVLTPSSQVSSPIDQQPPGVFTTPFSLIDMIPAPVTTNAVATTQTPAGAGNITLVAATSRNLSIVTYQSVTGVLQLDVPRNITITSAANASGTTLTVSGWDIYGLAMTETLNNPNTTTTQGKKAFAYIRSISASGAVAQAITVGVGNIFGLGHLATNANYIGIPMWNGLADTGLTTTGQTAVGPLANNPITTGAAGSGSVVVTVASTAGLTNGQLVKILAATTTDGITAAQLNITAPITVVDATHFAYNTIGNATAGGIAGGGAAVTYTLVNYNVAGSFVAGDQAVASATTGDVRGTYAPSSSADGIKRLTINYYSASGDARKTILAQTGAFILNNNPLATGNATTTITVTAPNHQLTTGETVTISGGTGTINGVTAAQYNISAAVTVVDANSFTYSTGITSGGAPASGGGAVVLITPGYGNLYSSPIGRFGVAQA